ncbi:MAG: hypothetical protein ACKOK7_08100, partial [Solirubrobacterales bacterium]
MSTDPLGQALGSAEAPATARPGAAPGQPQPGTAQEAAGASQQASPPHHASPPHQAPSAYEPQPAQPAWEGPQPERSLLERRPEILVGAAMAGGFIAAQLLGRIRGR